MHGPSRRDFGEFQPAGEHWLTDAAGSAHGFAGSEARTSRGQTTGAARTRDLRSNVERKRSRLNDTAVVFELDVDEHGHTKGVQTEWP